MVMGIYLTQEEKISTIANIPQCLLFLMSQYKYQQENNTYCLYNSQYIDDFSSEMLSSTFWQKNNAVTGTAQGRGTTYFVAYQKHEWVLRHYYRGGLMGKINNDSYWFTGLKNTRAAQEFSLLQTMHEKGLSTPEPIAYRIIKKGFFYRADILTSRIKNASDLVAILQSKKVESDTWQAIGKNIKQLHQNGIYHHDLNSHNILLDDKNKPWIIDFDRGEQRSNSAADQSWQAQNMARLLRSFKKEVTQLKNFYWQEENWQQLLAGYNS